jgi:hypothetical protein
MSKLRPVPLLLLLVVAAGCLKPKPPLAAAVAEDVAVAAVRTEYDSRQVVAAPLRLRDELLAELSSRNLRPTAIPEAELPGLLGKGNSRFHLGQVAARDGGAELIVLAEAEASFYAQVAGRYRWTVACTLSVADRDELDGATTVSFEVPVFLQFSHEKEDAALAEATPVIRRKLGEMLDQVLSTRGGG